MEATAPDRLQEGRKRRVRQREVDGINFTHRQALEAFARGAVGYPSDVIVYCHGARIIEKTRELPPIKLRSKP